MNNLQLVIAEKPSVAISIAAVLGASTRRDGFFEGNGFIVSWCFGHMAALAQPEMYDEKFGKWRTEDLPIIPDNWQYSISQDKADQFKTLNSLMNRSDVETVINACDAGREGELIFREVYYLAGCEKPMKRLWISSMEDDAIRQGFRELRNGHSYDFLYDAALCRAKADWLFGINATRLFSGLYHRTLHAGRVISPTLAMLTERQKEIDNFKPTPFYTAELCFDGFSAMGRRLETEEDAEEEAANAMSSDAVVISVSVKEKSEAPPCLYDLTSLQREANRKYGYTAQQTLDYLQSLYEKKLCTYPRTDSRFLPDSMEYRIPSFLALCAATEGTNVPANCTVLCNSAKVSDHHAIIPTESVAAADITSLPVGEREILHMLAKRVILAVSAPFRYTETEVRISCGNSEYVATGNQIKALGWREYVGTDVKENVLPALREGQKLAVEKTVIHDGKTQAPRHYSEDTLLLAMENAGAKDLPEDAERRGLGTPATRASIIEKTMAAGLAERNKAQKHVYLHPTQVGASLASVLPETLRSPMLTAEWEQKLKAVEKGEMLPAAFMAEIEQSVTDLVKNYSPVDNSEQLFPSGRKIIGKCPRCGADVAECKKGYFCESRSCRFGIWRDNRYLAANKINLTTKMMTALLTDGKACVSGIYAENSGKHCDAYLTLDDDGFQSSFNLTYKQA